MEFLSPVGPFSSDTADKEHDLKFWTKPVVACQKVTNSADPDQTASKEAV